MKQLYRDFKRVEKGRNEGKCSSKRKKKQENKQTDFSPSVLTSSSRETIFHSLYINQPPASRARPIVKKNIILDRDACRKTDKLIKMCQPLNAREREIFA